MLYTIIDIETTGNGLKGNNITEISIFKFDGETVVDEFTSLVNPQCPIPNFITGLTGIDDEMVRNAPTFKTIAKHVLTITEDCVFVAHAVNFDYGVIKEEFRRLGIEFIRKKLCTVRLSRKLIPGLQSYSLGKLCSAVGIPLKDRHRARGDAKATVTLFKRLLQQPDAHTVIKNFLNARSQEATLPPHLDKKVVESIPNKPGVYYFLDRNKTIIYVGKAKNLKKRVLGHFYDKSEHEIKLCREVADIDVQLSGSELIALLMESAAIKQHYPKYNRAQKKSIRQFAVFHYENRLGLLQLGFASAKQVHRPLMLLPNVTECRAVLQLLCDAYQLCPKYCQLTPQGTNHGICQSGFCETHCRHIESVDEYNAKVEKAIATIRNNEGSTVIEQPGRRNDEKGFVFMENGNYRGYGFVSDEENIHSHDDLMAFLVPQKNTPETERIVASYLRKNTMVHG